MRTPQKKLVALLLLWAVVILFQVIWVTQPWQLNAAEAELLELQIERGAKLYASNCTSCHGADGQGFVGPALNRLDWHGDLTEVEKIDVANMLVDTITNGRGGTDTPTWDIQEANGERVIVSRSRMPAFGQSAGGPLNEQEVEDLVMFLMNYQWENAPTNLVAGNIPAAVMTKIVDDNPVPITAADLPESPLVSDLVNDRARELLIEAGCLTCHTLGNYGGAIAPNLSQAGDWLTPDFLEEWLRDPSAVIPRMPTVWLGGGEEKVIDNVDWTGKHRTRMPSIFQLKPDITDEEIDILVEYLTSLRSN